MSRYKGPRTPKWIQESDDDVRAAYEAGKFAYWKSKPKELVSNPHHGETREASAWSDGWVAAAKHVSQFSRTKRIEREEAKRLLLEAFSSNELTTA